MSDETKNVVLDYETEHARFQKEMYGLVRAIGFKAYKRMKRPKVCWNDMVDDACIFAWRTWRSLRLRGLDPQNVGVYAIADRAVLSTLQGAVFRPVGTGCRSHADSIYNKDNGVRVRSNREPWQLDGSVEDGQDESDVMADWNAWIETLDDDDRAIILALESGDTSSLKDVKGLKRRKRLLADRFCEFRNR